jgi:putative monooxygenase
MKSAVFRLTQIHPHERGGGARTFPVVTKSVGSPILSGITELEPNASIPLHTHNCGESVHVLDGTAIFEVDGIRHELTAGDTTWIFENVPHRFINASGTCKLRIYWTYTSNQATRTLIATGETRLIESERPS